MTASPPFPESAYATTIDWALTGLEREGVRVHVQPDTPEMWEGSTMVRIDPPELYIQVVGVMHIHFENGEHVGLEPGEFCVLPRQCPHRNIVTADQQPGFDCLDIRFARDCIEILRLRTFVGQYPNHTSGLLKTFTRYPMLRKEFLRSHEFFCSSRPTLQRAGRAALIQSLALLIDCLSSEHTPPDCIQACKLIISANLSNPALNASMLAARLDRNRDYLCHMFHRQTGIRLTDYINQSRIEEAKDLLRSGTMRIADVSRLCGYSSPVYFGKVFRRFTGLTPTVYRDLGLAGDVGKP